MITTANHAWGFYGTCRSNFLLTDQQAAEVFNLVAQHLIAVQIVPDAESAQRALDSRHGRHFADALGVDGGAHAGQEPQAIATAAVIVLNGDAFWTRKLKAESRQYPAA
jgi:hypothetical protein